MRLKARARPLSWTNAENGLATGFAAVKKDRPCGGRLAKAALFYSQRSGVIAAFGGDATLEKSR
jgi:hypothetical protein